MVADNSYDSEYRSALSFLYSFVDYERNARWRYDTGHFNLDRVRLLLAALGNPHHHGWYVHVAGTNGKGSVCTMVASALREAGLTVGLYISPHLVTFRERIRVNGQIMSRDEVIASVRRVRSAAESISGLTFFDVWTVLAFDHFARRGTDASVIEVGMGGRLDSTNVITPALSVITSISMDHRGKLGETPAEIAAEKAGILKKGVPAVSASQTPDVAMVLAARAAETGSDLVVVGRDVEWERDDDLLRFRGRRWTVDRVRVPLAGEFQFENAATAFAALETLDASGHPMAPEIAKRGIERTRWPGRLETIGHRPEIIVDGACNIGAMTVVADHIASRSPREQNAAVVAICRDKDVAEVLAILGGAVARVVFTQVRNPRVMDAAELAAKAPAGVESFIEPDPADALKRAFSLAGENGLVLVTGSLYLVGEVFRMYGLGEGEE